METCLGDFRFHPPIHHQRLLTSQQTQSINLHSIHAQIPNPSTLPNSLSQPSTCAHSSRFDIPRLPAESRSRLSAPEPLPSHHAFNLPSPHFQDKKNCIMGAVEKTILKRHSRSEESFHCCGKPEDLQKEAHTAYLASQELESLSQEDGDRAGTQDPKKESSNPQRKVKTIPLPDFYQVPPRSVGPSTRPTDPPSITPDATFTSHLRTGSSSDPSNNYSTSFQSFHETALVRSQRAESNASITRMTPLSLRQTTKDRMSQFFDRPVTLPSPISPTLSSHNPKSWKKILTGTLKRHAPTNSSASSLEDSMSYQGSEDFAVPTAHHQRASSRRFSLPDPHATLKGARRRAICVGGKPLASA